MKKATKKKPASPYLKVIASRGPQYRCKHLDSGWCLKLDDDCWHMFHPEECSESELIEKEKRS